MHCNAECSVTVVPTATGVNIIACVMSCHVMSDDGQGVADFQAVAHSRHLQPRTVETNGNAVNRQVCCTVGWCDRQQQSVVNVLLVFFVHNIIFSCDRRFTFTRATALATCTHSTLCPGKK